MVGRQPATEPPHSHRVGPTDYPVVRGRKARAGWRSRAGAAVGLVAMGTLLGLATALLVLLLVAVAWVLVSGAVN